MEQRLLKLTVKFLAILRLVVNFFLLWPPEMLKIHFSHFEN